MAERDSYAPGTPSWVDLGAPDPEAAAAFYSALFGWDVMPPGDEAGGYRMCMLKGRPVAGIAPATVAGAPPWWTTYVTVDDAAETAKAVEAAGGQVLAEAFDVMEFGRMAILTDPGGATFSAWQPKQHHGAGLVNEPGSLTWNELTTRHLDTAATFYNAVFGWDAEQNDMGGGVNYTTWKLSGTDSAIGGAMPMVGDQWPADLPDHWMVYFAVEDCDATAARVVELGGVVSVPPMDIPTVGRFAVVNGKQGEVFSIIANA